MKFKRYIPLLLIAAIGLYFLGSSITANVVSQSCCFPPDCGIDNLCDVTNSNQYHLDIDSMIVGISIISIAMILHYQNKNYL